MKAANVVALGGNAIKRKSESGTFWQQRKNIKRAVEELWFLIKDKERPLIVTHGNGPQVGRNLRIQEAARERDPSLPMKPVDIVDAETQGELGYLIEGAIVNLLDRQNLHRPTGVIGVRVLVDKDDPDFGNPSKPIGDFYTNEEAQGKIKDYGWVMKKVSSDSKGWRRVVPSPRPLKIIEEEFLLPSIRAGHITIALGGGGVPVVKRSKFGFRGIEAVVDKDLTSALLAEVVGAEMLITLTDVEKVYLNFGMANQVSLDCLNVSEAKRYLKEGHFPPGTMGPKIEAHINFLEKGGKKGLITDLFKLKEALSGKTGTWIVKD